MPFCAAQSIRAMTRFHPRLFCSYHKKKIIIHVPVSANHHKHTHTKVKNIHHHHKPIIIKEEKIIKEIIKKKPIPIHIKEEVEHDHYHHHYKHTHAEPSYHTKSHKYLSESTDSGNSISAGLSSIAGSTDFRGGSSVATGSGEFGTERFRGSNSNSKFGGGSSSGSSQFGSSGGF